MKTKKFGLFMLCLIFAGFSIRISAQENLDALIKKCEKLESVDMEVVKNKINTKKDVESRAIRIRITNDKKLVNEFLDAFRKDSKNAEQSTDMKDKNEPVYFQCRFSKQTYAITIKGGENATVTVNNTRHQIQSFSRDSLQFEKQKQYRKRMEQHQKRLLDSQQARIKQQQGKMKQHQERMKQHQERMKQYQERMKQYKSGKLDSILLKHNTIADSLILKSTARFNSINWDSVASKFGKDIDSMVNKSGVEWEEILKKYEVEDQ